MNVDPPSDDESLDWNIGVIDGICPPPNKADIVNQLKRAQSTKSRKNINSLQQSDYPKGPTYTTAPPVNVDVPSDVEITKQLQRVPSNDPHLVNAEP